MKFIVDSNWLNNQLGNENVRIIDCRFDLGNQNKGLDEYLQDHIPGALYFDLNKDLSGRVELHGGRHPLPDLAELQDKLSAAGIDKDTTVVAYDEMGSPYAARLLWLLHYLGHEKVYILNGGYKKWVSESLPISSDIPTYERKEFLPSKKHELLAEMAEVKEKLHKFKSTMIIDSRDYSRYQGIEEPIDRIGGHIPSAKNFFWKNVLDENGMWKDIEELQENFNSLPKEKEMIVYCGSGVTACPNFIALKEAGYPNVKLYVGSWSDWISYKENIIEKCEE